jgi:hypothetical protein
MGSQHVPSPDFAEYSLDPAAVLVTENDILEAMLGRTFLNEQAIALTVTRQLVKRLHGDGGHAATVSAIRPL